MASKYTKSHGGRGGRRPCGIGEACLGHIEDGSHPDADFVIPQANPETAYTRTGRLE